MVQFSFGINGAIAIFEVVDVAWANCQNGTIVSDELSITVNKVVRAASIQLGREVAQPLREALNELTELDGPSRAEKSFHLAAALPHISSATGAGLVTIWLGAEVEGGVDPSLQTPHLIDCMLRFTRKIELLDRDTEDSEIDAELAIGLQYLGQGLVAHLSRDLKNLQAIQADGGVIAELERVEECSPGPMWVLALIRNVTGTLVVLHGEELIGCRVAYKNISNCFHLFTLLQSAVAGVMPGARKVTHSVLAVARGESHAQCSDEAWWHYGQPISDEPNIMASVFGEASPRAINSIDGQQVMLLWPQILKSRSWDAGFFGPTLHNAPAGVKLIDMLSDADVKHWRDRLGLPELLKPAANKPWWKIG